MKPKFACWFSIWNRLILVRFYRILVTSQVCHSITRGCLMTMSRWIPGWMLRSLKPSKTNC
jgi:hypothetical protein